ncbi:MAG: hypothetical protein H6550_04420 [Chitinophagales bacterium]|nr:hypothetical protein [Chitinophagales bacterium]
MIQEIAIRKVKNGMLEKFIESRKKFIDLLKKNDGIILDCEFESFFTMPGADDTEVLVGTTIYESAEVVTNISEKLLQTAEANAFFSTFDMKAFALTKPVEVAEEEIINNLQKSSVVEVAIRRPKDGHKADFNDRRDDFFRLVAACPGHVFDCEYIDVNTGNNVVLIGWKDKVSFQNALSHLQTKNEMMAFFSILDVKAYQATEKTSI